MNSNKSNTTRRAFFLKGGATLGAGVAAAAGTTGTLAFPPPTPPQRAADATEREAILKTHQTFIADVENGSAPGAAATHRVYRSNARQVSDQLVLSEDGLRAEATWHVDVKLGTPLEGDSTAAQMARQQGMLSDLHWESGRLEAQYVKRAGKWRIRSLRYSEA